MSARWLGTLALAVLAALQVRAEPATKLWDTYLDSAVFAIKEGRLQNAEVLLRAAIQAAEPMGKGNTRSTISWMLLGFLYLDMKKLDDAKEAYTHMARIDAGTFNESLLPAAGSLFALANYYYEKNDSDNAQSAVKSGWAERCMLLDTAIQKKALPEDSLERATPMAFLGLVMVKEFKFQEAVKYYEAALQIWDKEATRLARMTSASQHFSLSHVQAFAALDGDGDHDPLTVTMLLGRAYRFLGDEYRNKKQLKEAKEAYGKSRQYIEQVRATQDAAWPGYPWAAYPRRELALLYEAEEDHAAAEQCWREVLKIFEAADGPQGDRVADAASALADLLRKMKRDADAAEVVQRYHLKAPVAGQ